MEWLTYTVRFQNTGTDTAYTVVIDDHAEPAPSARDPASADHFAHAHGPGHRQRAGMAEFRFENILLPDSNVNALGSQGFVTFRIRPGPGLPHTTPIENNGPSSST